ncbi:helix-turn-helix domain-containing protein [Paenibacillus massiliensis]|uniref:helix-turn-helix domain-containing protein n=1 Tax=Paenibacillus massiliensis TaxID=225917 RepID=UPI00046FB932|nr:helix-turn-helix domain-containing protein [Paenibacillus massiliensis]
MKKWNSVFANLAFSYISIVLVIVLLLCSVFYIYFSNNYKQELHDKHQMILENTAHTIETSVLERVQQIYLDISLNRNADVRWFADSSLDSNLSRVIDLQELLKSKVTSNSDLVHAIHLYNPKQNILLSSIYGLEYQADQGSSSSVLADWVQGMRSNEHSSLWTGVRPVPVDALSSLPDNHDAGLITYAHSYPFQESGENADLMIAIDVKESAINGIIQNMMPSPYSSTFIVDSSGTSISDLSQEGPTPAYGSEVINALMSSAESGSFHNMVNDTSYVVSYETLPSTGWKIMSAMPASSYYEKTIVVQKLILGICLLVILIGVALSGFLARASYSPIKRLVGKIKDSLDPATAQVTNEFKLIDTAFLRLSDKVSSLEETLLASSSVIKHNTILTLLRNGYSREEWSNERSHLRLPHDFRHYACIVVNSGEVFARLSSSHMEYVVHEMIKQLEEDALSHSHSLSHPRSHIIAEELPDKKLVIILGAEEANNLLLEELSSFVLTVGRQQLSLDFQLAWGSWVQELTDIHESYNKAQALMKYGYFLPEMPILRDHHLLEREHSLEELPQSILVRFREKLHARQADEVTIVLDQLVAAMREDNYPADYCHFILSNTVFTVSDYMKNVRYSHPEQGKLDLYYQYMEIQNILEFRSWLVDMVADFIMQMEKRNSERAVSSIELAREYIHSHLAEDLSLEAVAAQVYISPKYLSKLFKEELGVTYTSYITNQRMEQAKALIETTDMTVEQVAATVGYGTAAYFIKKFKEIHGCTPGNYLRTLKQT